MAVKQEELGVCGYWSPELGFDRRHTLKPDHLRDKVLMLDAGHVFRKVTHKVYGVSPEQMRNLIAVTWLCLAQVDRFTALVQDDLEPTKGEAEGANFADLLAALDAAAAFFAGHLDDATLTDTAGRRSADCDAFASKTLLQIDVPRKQNAKLTRARDLPLPHLMNGRIPVQVKCLTERGSTSVPVERSPPGSKS